MALPVSPLAYPIRYMPDKPPRCSREALFTYPVVGLPPADRGYAGFR